MGPRSDRDLELRLVRRVFLEAPGAELERLEQGVIAKLRVAANENTDAAIRSALASLLRFAEGPAQSRILFIKPHVHGEVDVAAHNEWSLLLWAI